jgi:penicillin amidase
LPAARSALLLQTLGSAWRETERLLGADATRWRWGDLHRIRFQHPLHAIAPPALQAQLALPDFPRGGNTDTPNATTYDDAGFDVRSGASFRMVLDVGNWDAARMTNAPGQSGDPRSPFYGSLLEGWANEESFPMLYTRAAIEAATVQRLRLRPAPAPTPTPERMAGPGSDH